MPREVTLCKVPPRTEGTLGETYDITILLPCSDLNDREKKVLDEIGLIAEICILFIIGGLTLLLGYVAGHKDGSREGFHRGKAIGRHAAGREVSK